MCGVRARKIDSVTEYKYLGTIFTDKLNWDKNTDAIAKKGQQRLYFLRKLNSFSVDKTVMNLFYKSFIESILTFSFICWFRNLTIKQKKSLERITSLSSKIIGDEQRSLGRFCDGQILKKAYSITKDDCHVLFGEFEHMKSGRRFRCMKCRTNRYGQSFIPSAIRLLNDPK